MARRPSHPRAASATSLIRSVGTRRRRQALGRSRCDHRSLATVNGRFMPTSSSRPDSSARPQRTITSFMCLAISLSSALDEFDDVSVWVFDHGDACVRQNLRLRHGELHPFFFEHSAHATEITDHKTQAPDAEFFVQTNGARRGHLLGVHSFDWAGAVAQPVDITKRGLYLFRLLRPTVPGRSPDSRLFLIPLTKIKRSTESLAGSINIFVPPQDH